jgi:hypothetical protein
MKYKDELILYLGNYGANSNKDFQYYMKNGENIIDGSLWLSSIYPKSIKYNFLYTQKAKLISNNVLIPKMSEIKSNFVMTAFLIYLTKLYDEHNDKNTDEIIKILTKVTSFTSDQLITVLDYSDDTTRNTIIQRAGTIANKFYYMYSSNNINYNLPSSSKYELKYFGSSDEARAEEVYKNIEESFYRCTTNDLLSNLSVDSYIPESFYKIFGSYNNQNSDNDNDSKCNSLSTQIVTTDLRMINEVTSELDATSFIEFISRLEVAVNGIENTDNSLDIDSEAYENLQFFIPVIVKYTVNRMTNHVFQKNSIPLINTLNNNFLLRFKLGFSDKYIQISPAYSQINLQENINPLKNKFNSLR